MTIRKGLLGDQPSARVVGLWNWEAKPGTTLERLQAVYLSGLEAVDKFDAKRDSLTKDIRFTPEGRREQLLDYAAKELAPILKQSRNALERAKQDLAARRANLKPPTADKGDLVGAMLRREIRDWLGRMDASKQAEFLASQGANLDPNIAMAIIEAPPEMGVVSPTQRERIIDRRMRAQFGTEIDDLGDVEDAIKRAEASVEQSRELLQIEAAAGDRRKFDEAAAPFEKPVAAAWLRKSGDEIHVVDLERNIGRKPTPQELETGIFYENYEAYAAARGIKTEEAA
ncbi:hypothetical protein [Bradyrhizobium sp. AUGA SZCCT0182]|uniref:hypothetical protein n=1 Tax=Bradyrhizobium sp. AUGA SZCCT0182 TaxID=2807667 RepID=UPI001BA5A67C|nr:hypothetical protein [Bradyrhizobium sp. AUGA SZCCT0182]MBR1238177.1 hypothetical protein [Bradyrhizobium sp. AUGA SZCCT0182]